MHLDNHPGTALIPGASSGIGAVYADHLARRGYDLILVARNRSRLEGIASRLGHLGNISVETVPADLTQPIELRRLEQRLRDDPSLSMLVNNAGMMGPKDLVGADADRLERMVQLNVTAVMWLAVAAATAFAARRRGIVVNIASVVALVPDLFNGVPSGTKAFVLNLTQSMQQELGPYGVKVQVVLPGAVRTELWERSGTDISSLPRSMVMDVEEVVGAALAGLDAGEPITMPSLPDIGDWEAFIAARRHLEPNLSHDYAALVTNPGSGP